MVHGLAYYYCNKNLTIKSLAAKRACIPFANCSRMLILSLCKAARFYPQSEQFTTYLHVSCRTNGPYLSALEIKGS